MREVLIVDDEFDLTSTVKAILEYHGYKTNTCSTGKEAFECIRESRPDLVLLDVMIPLGNGFEVLDRVRADPDLAETAVILMNSVPPPQGKPVTWQAFLKKPLSINTLLAAVEQFIGRPAETDAAGS
jgi:DNA-binding response OmpR family regulator